MKLYASLISAMILLFTGCSNRPATIVGKWAYVSPGNDMTYEFNSDGTFAFDEHAVYQSIHSHQSSSGTYYFHSGTLTLNTLQEQIGIDAKAMAAIDARERLVNPTLHISQDKGDVPVKIEQPTLIFLCSVSQDNSQLKLKDTSNAADLGHLYARVGD